MSHFYISCGSSVNRLQVLYKSGPLELSVRALSRRIPQQFSTKGYKTYSQLSNIKSRQIPVTYQGYQSRKMSTQNKRDSKKKSPSPPRPSSRLASIYIYSSVIQSDDTTISNCTLKPMLTTQRPPPLPPKRNPPPPPCQNIHLLRLRACLPRRKPLSPRWAVSAH